MAVVVQLYPQKAAVLIKYLDIVHRTLRDFGGQAWLHYDENFRHRTSHDPLFHGRYLNLNSGFKLLCLPN